MKMNYFCKKIGTGYYFRILFYVIILLQEHWLTPDNLIKFQQHFVDYFTYGSSAMLGCHQSGMLRGRPFGGVMTLVRKDMRGFTQTIHCDDRFVIILLLIIL